MQKIIITGELNRLSDMISSEISKQFEIVKCDFGESSLKRGIRMHKPRLIMCFKSEAVSSMVFAELLDNFPEVGIIVVREGSDETLSTFNKKGLVTITRPVKIDELNSAIVEALAQSTPVAPPKRILAVDDDAMVLRNLKEMIGKNYVVEFATSGIKALEMMEAKEYDLILLDYEMPNMSGYQVFKEMKKHDSMKDIPVVFLTGVSDKRRIMEVVQIKPAGYLLKPVDRFLLADTLKDVLA